MTVVVPVVDVEIVEVDPGEEPTLFVAVEPGLTRRRRLDPGGFIAWTKSRGITRSAVAQACGVSRQAVSSWVTGAARCGDSSVEALAKAYGLRELVAEGVLV